MADATPLKLHIPEPHSRPGDRVDFSYLTVPSAGSVRRPDPQSPERDMRDLAYELVRVLDDQGRAVGAWNPRLPPEALKAGLHAMVLTRAFDDRLFRAHRQGKTSFFLKSTGEEAVACACALAMDRQDMCFPTYRMAGYLIARDYPLVQMVNQIFSNAKDPLGGRQMPILYSARDYGFYSLSGNVGPRFGHAVGWAMASAYKGDTRIAIAFIGEGSTAEGDFHEALTMATVYRVPVILAVTNNQWAISTFQGLAGGEQTTFAAKAIAYGLPGLRVDGNDYLAVTAAIQWAAERARSNHGATLIEFFTYRAAAHSTSDDPSRYRPADEAECWPLGDPIHRLAQHLIALGEWSEDQQQGLSAEAAEAVEGAVKEGEAVGILGQSKPDVGKMFENVFETEDWRLSEERRELGV